MPCALTVAYVGQFRAGEHCFKCILSTVEMGADRRAGEMEPGYRLCCSARGQQVEEEEEKVEEEEEEMVEEEEGVE